MQICRNTNAPAHKCSRRPARVPRPVSGRSPVGAPRARSCDRRWPPGPPDCGPSQAPGLAGEPTGGGARRSTSLRCAPRGPPLRCGTSLGAPHRLASGVPHVAGASFRGVPSEPLLARRATLTRQAALGRLTAQAEPEHSDGRPEPGSPRARPRVKRRALKARGAPGSEPETRATDFNLAAIARQNLVREPERLSDWSQRALGG
jgi:hypothetical protein